MDILPGLGGARATGDASWKPLIRDHLGLAEDDVVLIHGLACTEPGCPPVETVVVVMEAERTRTWKIPLAPDQLTVVLLTQTLDKHPNGNKDHD